MMAHGMRWHIIPFIINTDNFYHMKHFVKRCLEGTGHHKSINEQKGLGLLEKSNVVPKEETKIASVLTFFNVFSM